MGTAQSLSALSMQGSAAFPGFFCGCYTNVIPQTVNLLYTEEERGRRRPRHARAHTDCTEERIAKESARAVLEASGSGSSAGSRGRRDKCARSAAAGSGRSTTFHQASPQSLHPLLFHVRRGKPADLSGEQRGELGTGGLKGPSCPVTGTIPLPPRAVPGEPFVRMPTSRRTVAMGKQCSCYPNLGWS